MPSPVDIANVAFTILGKPGITSFEDGTVQADLALATYDIVRRKLLMGPSIWRFSIVRTKLPALSASPASGPYLTQFEMPSDCLRPIMIGDTWAGLNLDDYRLGPTDADYSIEGRNILCDYGAPLDLQYVGDATDTGIFDPQFVFYLGAECAWLWCEAVTGSDAKKQAALMAKKDALIQAAASNALMKAPEFNADDTWVAVRLQ